MPLSPARAGPRRPGPPGERLAALSAARMPARAAALLAFLAGPGSADTAARAATLANGSRQERVRALAAALAAAPPEARRARALAVASAERPSVAGAALAVARLSAGAAPAPLLERLLRERLEA